MKQQHPPSWTLKFLRFFCKDNYLEQIEGDLFELFDRDPSQRRFIWNTLRFMRRRYIKGLEDFTQLSTLAMIKNYLKIALRALTRQKTYTIINIMGLAIALASAMLISVYVVNEQNYDSFHKDGERMFRITKRELGGYTPPLLAHTIREEVPQFRSATRATGVDAAMFKKGGASIKQDGGVWADEYFFQVFEVPFLAGDIRTALSKPNSVVLTESIAKKYFPYESAMAKIIEIDGDQLMVTGIIKDLPRNTHYPFQYVISYPLDLKGTYYWTGGDGITYAKLSEHASLKDAKNELTKLYEKYAGPEIIEYTGHESFEEF
ncbi:MAG: ABC transporter permease, partial [Bacteroidota bacterium]